MTTPTSQDYVRTSTYQSAMLQNVADFKDKVVLDVGAGTGKLTVHHFDKLMFKRV